MSERQKPLVLTSGDPSGIGPEIAIKAWNAVGHTHPFVILGSIVQLGDLANSAGIPVVEIQSPGQIRTDALCVIDQAFPVPPKAGLCQPENASGTIEMIKRAVFFVKEGQASAVVTNPIHKKVLIEGAGFKHPGHTEYLAELDGKEQSVMMLSAPDLKVVPVTIHIPLKDVSGVLTETLLSTTIKILHAALKRDFQIEEPKIAVAGLNPHAGEGGEMGMEERDLIGPALERLRKIGIDLKGPISADTMFHVKARNSYDAAVCMYHDQALIPIKTIDFDRGVNVTLGLSFIRTSPDHGTAFDIAGKGLANPSSLIEAIKMASEMAKNRAAFD